MCSRIKTKVVFVSLVLAIVRVQSDNGTNATSQLDRFCRRFEHRTAVLNNKLYIDSGYVNFNPIESDAKNYTSTASLYAPSFAVINHNIRRFSSLSRPFDHHKLHVPQNRTRTSKASICPDSCRWVIVSRSNQWEILHFWGYFPSTIPSEFVTWMYDDSHGSWNKAETRGNSVSYVAHDMSAVAQDAGKGFCLGGYHDSQTQKQWTTPRLYTPNLIEFDMFENRYTNRTGPPDGKGRGEGLMVFIQASTSGLLIYFGGIVRELQGADVSGMPMNQIWIYDISLRRWYMQYATGDIPDERTRFCGGAAWPDGKSSFNIYIYGGLRPNGNNIDGTTGFDDLYVLSLPSFIWVRLYLATSILNAHAQHHSLTCDIINGTQMIILGGTFPYTTDCDSIDTYGQHNVDLGELSGRKSPWEWFRNDNPPYRLPSELVQLIGGNDKGGANVTGPVMNRTYDQYLFEKAYKVAQRYPTPTTSVSPPTVTVSAGKKNESSRSVLIKAIVGSIFGGILIEIAAIYLFRRLRKGRDGSVPVDEKQQNTIPEKMNDSRDSPEELQGPDTLELPNECRGELWVEPVEMGSR